MCLTLNLKLIKVVFIETMYLSIVLNIYPISLYHLAPAIPIDHDIKTIRNYKYIHKSKPRLQATRTKYCMWQEEVKCSSHLLYTKSCPTSAVQQYVADAA